VRLRHVAQLNPPVAGLSRADAGREVSFLPLDRVWADERFDPSRTIEFSGDLDSYNAVAEGDVLLPKVSPTFSHGRVAIARGLVGRRALATSEVFVVRPHDPRDARFIRYRLMAADFRAEGQAAWAGVAGLKRISAAFVNDVGLPNSAWQNRYEISDSLDRESARIGELKALCHRQLDDLSTYFASRHDTIMWAGRPVPLKTLLTHACVGIVVQPAQMYDEDGEVDCFRPVNVAHGTLIREGLVRISKASHRANSRSELRTGDVVVVRSGKAGSAAVVPDWASGGNCVDLLILRPSELYRPRYLVEVLSSSRVREELERTSVGTVQGHMNLSAIRRLVTPTLNLDRQDEVIREVDHLRAETSGMADELRQVRSLLREYRDALITEAVTGKLDVTRLSEQQLDESAHAASEGERPEVLSA